MGRENRAGVDSSTVHLASDTRAFVCGRRGRIETCDSRSLLMERFANPELKKDQRHQFFKRAIKVPSSEAETFLKAWQQDIRPGGRLGLSEDGLYFARLQSRLMVNMAGGVMENAGLCLHRFSGEPYIPGSAVKGCARRFAIQELLDTSQEEKLEKLVGIAWTFGWSVEDWKDSSDFAFGCETFWSDDLKAEVRKRLWSRSSPDREFSEKAFHSQMSNFKGQAQFLPAYPTEPCQLELDVLTSHHSKYYQGDPGFSQAPDTEDPNPVIFPTVAPHSTFVFAVISEGQEAIGWLRKGLEIFGIGAKTNAGYGWFTPDDEAKCEFLEKIRQKEREKKAKHMPKEEVRRGVEKLAVLTEDEIRSLVNSLKHETDYSKPEIRILLEALKGPQRSVLESIRTSGTRPDRIRLESLRAAARSLGVDLS